MKFPQYRRYVNGKSYFKIESKEFFTEYKLFTNQIEVFNIEVKILPDRNYIDDLLNNYEPHWEKIDESEFLRFITSHNL